MKIAECRLFYAEEIRFAANLRTPGLVADGLCVSGV